MKKQKIYISGPITGNLQFREHFDTAHKLISIARPAAAIVNPTTICSDRWSWSRCMLSCLWHLMGCRQIAMIEGWQQSRGARIELLVALLLKMEVYSVVVSGEAPRFYPYQR